jgi:DNA-binding IclR family transcriptional regulator
MSREPIPEELRRFLLTSVPSVPFVEALLLLRETGGQPIETTHIARRLYLPEHAATAVLEQLAEARIVERMPQGPSAHRFAPHPELASVVELLAAYYRSHLVEVTDVIHSRTARTARQFADAFKLRKEP